MVYGQYIKWFGRFGLAGKTDLDAAEADQVVDAITDISNNFVLMMKEKDEKKKEELKEELKSETLPKWLKMMEELLTSHGGEFFTANCLTWADLAVYNFVQMLKVTLSCI